MMAPLATTTMTAYLEAITGALEAHAWPSPVIQIGYRQPDLELDEEQVIRTPALLLSCASRAREDSPPIDLPGRVARRCSLDLYCLLSFTTPGLALELLEFSEAVCALIERREFTGPGPRGNRWGLMSSVEVPEQLSDRDADLQFNGVAARVLSWQQIVYLPESSS